MPDPTSRPQAPSRTSGARARADTMREPAPQSTAVAPPIDPPVKLPPDAPEGPQSTPPQGLLHTAVHAVVDMGLRRLVSRLAERVQRLPAALRSLAERLLGTRQR